MAFTYGGVDLLIPEDELLEFASTRYTIADLIPFNFPPPRVSWGTIAWKTPYDWYFRPTPVRSNTLYWPVGASRWAFGFFWAAEQDLASIRTLVYGESSDEYNALTLNMDDGETEISTSLWMLPPLPVAPQKVYEDAQLATWLLPTTLPEDDTEPAYLMPLVDERYFWWQKSANIQVDEGVTTWSQLYTQISTPLGVSISAEAVDSAYLKPPVDLTNRFESLPMLLDAVAYSVGQRVVRRLDGTVVTIGPVAAKTALEAQLTLDYDRVGGGLLSLDVA